MAEPLTTETVDATGDLPIQEAPGGPQFIFVDQVHGYALSNNTIRLGLYQVLPLPVKDDSSSKTGLKLTRMLVGYLVMDVSTFVETSGFFDRLLERLMQIGQLQLLKSDEQIDLEHKEDV